MYRKVVYPVTSLDLSQEAGGELRLLQSQDSRALQIQQTRLHFMKGVHQNLTHHRGKDLQGLENLIVHLNQGRKANGIPLQALYH